MPSYKKRLQRSAKALPWVIILLTALVLSVLDTLIGGVPSGYGPIGDRSDYNVSYGECGISEIALSNHLGKQATLRQVECTGVPGAEVERDYFGFVHPLGVIDSRSNLVLRYYETPDDPFWTVAPRLTWLGEHLLRIEMSPSSPEKSVQQYTRGVIGDVTVLFLVGHGGTRISPDYIHRGPGWQVFYANNW